MGLVAVSVLYLYDGELYLLGKNIAGVRHNVSVGDVDTAQVVAGATEHGMHPEIPAKPAVPHFLVSIIIINIVLIIYI